MLISVLNNSPIPILQSQVVYQTGFAVLQQVPTVALASAVGVSTSTVVGIANQNIAIGQIGSIVITGDFSPINTLGFLIDDVVYLSNIFGGISNVPGIVTSIIGRVLSVSGTGSIFIRCKPPNPCPSPTPGGITGIQGATGIQGVTGISGSGSTLGMSVQGDLSLAVPLPFLNVGSEISGGVGLYINFRARREIPGISGTTTIQLELNGVPVIGALLSWTPADGAFSLKSIAIAVPVVGGDRLSFRILSVEGGNPQNIFSEVNT